MAPDVNINFGADSVGGDKTTVGGISDSSGISIGRQASAQVDQLERGHNTIIDWLTNLERRLVNVEVHVKNCNDTLAEIKREWNHPGEARDDAHSGNTIAMAIVMLVVFITAMSVLTWLTFGGILNVP